MAIIVKTPRLVIREFVPEEEEIYLLHFTDEEVCRYLPVRSRDERINIFRTTLTNYANSKKLGTWGMFDALNGNFIGSCLLRHFYSDPAKIEVGYSMEKRYWGKGIGTEMAAAMIDYAFLDAATSEVVGVTDPANIGSQRVLVKAGMEQLDNIIKDGEELSYFRIVRLNDKVI